MTATPGRGLSSSDAAARLIQFGPNDIRPRRRLAWLKRLWDVLSEPTLLVLVLVLVFYLSLGSRGEAVLLGVFVVIVITVTYIEEARTEGAVAALSALANPRALVSRDGSWVRIGGAEVVPGDLLNLSEGDRIVADASLIESHDLRIDESLLTGESVAVWKNALPASPEPERQVFAGSLIVQGQGLAVVSRTGLQTRVGQISGSLASIEPEPTPFQRSTSRLVRLLGGIALVACLSVVGISYFRGSSLTTAILQGLTLAIATVPEELPVILAVFMAMGARRLSAKGVLASRVPAVETLGAITLLAVDKTGTLTVNEMALKHAIPAPASDEAALLRTAAEACELQPFDPMEQSILSRSGPALGTLSFEYSLQGRPPRMGHIWDGERLAVKGAVEGVLQHCAIDGEGRAWVIQEARRLASLGLRVLGVASGRVQGPPPDEIPGGLRFLGLLAFEDPIRPGVAAAIATARQAGMRVVMMTGDSAETAAAIAAALGLRTERVVLGEELEQKADKIPDFARNVDVFARLAPEQKLILVQAWSAAGEVVGMSGDGVNDAPALIQAHVGIGLGLHGTDVAREAADLVLVDDSFGSLIEGIRIGRETTRRILRAALFVLAVHVPIIGIVLLCQLLDMPPMIEAAQIAFLELFIGPTCSVVFERVSEDEDVMQLKPRDPQASLLSWASSASALFQGAVIFAVVFLIYRSALGAGMPVPQARAEAFFTLMLADLLLCWTLLSDAPFFSPKRWDNGAYFMVSLAVMGVLLSLLSIPLTAGIFHMEALSPSRFMAAFGAAALAVLWYEAPKLFHFRGPR